MTTRLKTISPVSASVLISASGILAGIFTVKRVIRDENVLFFGSVGNCGGCHGNRKNAGFVRQNFSAVDTDGIVTVRLYFDYIIGVWTRIGRTLGIGGIGCGQQDGRCLSDSSVVRVSRICSGEALSEIVTVAPTTGKKPTEEVTQIIRAGITGFFCCSTGKLWHKSTLISRICGNNICRR